ncbi:MAG: inorganic phosphate transporter [Thermodesulfobacteriota bacterium]
MTILLLLFLAACFLAYSNGANDNFKGVATLFGSDTTNYRNAIWWATVTTFIGSVCSIFLADALVKSFSGKGLVPDIVAGSPEFLIAVALGAAITVMLATLTGFPISTTHSLTGALVGAGLVAVGQNLNFAVLGTKFFLPLLLSPFIAVTLAAFAYTVFRAIRVRLGITKEWCVCLGEKERVIPIYEPNSTLTMRSISTLDISIKDEETCSQRYNGSILGINVQDILDYAHFLSAGIVSFARGLNDTPKIVALLLVIKAFGIEWGMLAVAIGMAAGGLINAKKVAHTISKKITPMNHGQGFTANVVTGFLVIFASRLGVPVSTTHVSVGSIFGIGTITRQANVKVVSEILMSWVLTLPIAAILSALVYYMLKL